jgi:hypothetical protein
VRNSADFDQLVHAVTRIWANGIMLRRPGWPVRSRRLTPY